MKQGTAHCLTKRCGLSEVISGLSQSSVAYEVRRSVHPQSLAVHLAHSHPPSSCLLLHVCLSLSLQFQVSQSFPFSFLLSLQFSPFCFLPPSRTNPLSFCTYLHLPDLTPPPARSSIPTLLCLHHIVNPPVRVHHTFSSPVPSLSLTLPHHNDGQSNSQLASGTTIISLVDKQPFFVPRKERLTSVPLVSSLPGRL